MGISAPQTRSVQPAARLRLDGRKNLGEQQLDELLQDAGVVLTVLQLWASSAIMVLVAACGGAPCPRKARTAIPKRP
jgi:hypothetical protein